MKHELRSTIRSILAIQPLAILALAGTVNVAAGAELPVVCSGGCYAPGSSTGLGFVSSGAATTSISGNTLTVNQSTDTALLNWQSFNVSADGRVVFNQPRATSIALNRIFDAHPSRIFGAVEANGQIYLVNPNGMIFGRTARINAAGILASTLSITPETFAAGLLAPEILQANQPALRSDGRVYALDERTGELTLENGQRVEVKLLVEEGATLSSTGANGRVMLASREIDNSGTISSPDGQVILAAGDQVFLQASTDASLRGLLVEVAAGGEAWNRMTGDLNAARGNVTVAGLAVNQSGRISASTTVSENGSIRLLARDNPVLIDNTNGTKSLGAGQNGGRLEIGGTSRIEVLPELKDDATTVDDQKQLASRIEMSGREIFMRSGSTITAPAGELLVTAAANPAQNSDYDPSARIRVESGVSIDLSGSDVTLPMSRNAVTVELRANELRDSPAQRNGALRGQTVIVDARVGTPVADVSGALAAIPKSIAERTSHGGRSVFNSQGDIVIADGARFDVSGGVISYADGPVATSQLIGADGRLYDIGEADPSRTYVGILNPTYRRADDRWGFVDAWTSSVLTGHRQGYVHGADAGSVQFAAPSMIMNGALRADTTIGPYQRLPGQQPLGGEIIIGLEHRIGAGLPNYRAPSVTFSSEGSRLAVGDDGTLSPEQTLLLPTDYLTHGFTRTAVYSNGRITVPEETPLNLTAGSSLTLQGHQVDIGADINSASGSISATSVLTAGTGSRLDRAGVNVGDGVTLDVQGNWTNDQQFALLDPFSRPTSAIHADGGSIELGVDAEGSQLVIGDRVRLLANAGARRESDGNIQGGKGGSISIDGGAVRGALELGDDVTLQAFGVLGAAGGSFALTAPRIEVGSGATWGHAQRLDALPSDPNEQELVTDYLQIGTSLFRDHGFGSVSLIASGRVDRAEDGDALRIAGGTEIVARTSVLRLNDANVGSVDARYLGALANVVQPDEYQRQAMKLSFVSAPLSAGHLDQIGALSMQTGASIVADAGSSVRLSSVGGIDVDGTIRARGGSIDMRVQPPHEDIDLGYRPDIGLYVGQNATLDVSGTAIYRPIGNGLLQGSLYDGGSVTLQANRGHVVVEQGASIDVSGTAAMFDRNLSDTGLTRSVIASNAGTLSLIAPEAIAFHGNFNAHAGVGETGPAIGGELVMRLSRQRGFSPGPINAQPTFPTDPRVLRVTGEDIVVGGENPPNGLALLNRDVIDASGIDALTLEADGRIEFDSTTLAMNRRLVLDSPEILARDGADVSLSAHYLGIGNTVVSRTATPTTGEGSFSFQGEFVEAIGAVSLSGAATTIIASNGDLRLREAQQSTLRAGTLQAAGDLTLRADQVYPSTLSSYSVAALGDHATLRLETTGERGTTPLSAGGRLTLTAVNIEQFGTLRAPFGSIDLNAGESLTLGAGSLTSVSGAGAIIPFGRVENGEWVYDDNVERVVRTAIPERRIGLNAASIEQDQSATLDLQGGGDLYAYEWIPGTGGSLDALSWGIPASEQVSSETHFGRFAILPSQRGQFAPYDPQEMAGYEPGRTVPGYDPNSDLEVGDSIYLSGIPGLEAGYYALLPARYALLPGAMLLEPVGNTTDITPGRVSTLADGTPVVAGYRTFGTTGLGGTRYTGFAVRSGTQARDLAAYEDHNATKFFAGLATRLEQPRPTLPTDGGTLSLLAATSLDMRGSVNVAAAEAGRAGRVEIAGTNLEVVNALSGDASTVQIEASVLNSWKAGELWIGGTKRGENVDVVADSVRVADGVTVSANEIVLIANDTVDVSAGATVASTSSSRSEPVARDEFIEADLNLTGGDAGAAMLSVSDRNLYSLVREAGDLELGSVAAESGSALSTRGALLANAPASVDLSGDIRAAGAVWQLGSNTVRFDEAAHADGLNIDSTLVARMQEAGVLMLTSADAIEFTYGMNLGTVAAVDELVLQARSLRNLSGANVNFGAEHVQLVGLDQAAVAPAAGSGRLSITADSIELVGEDVDLKGADRDALRKNLSIDGFAATSLRAKNDIVGVGDFNMRVGGDLSMTADRVTASSGGRTSIDAVGGAVRIARPDYRQPASTTTAGILGGSLSISAKTIEHSGTLFLPSGVVSLQASENLSVQDTGTIDVSGKLVTAADRAVGTSGGTVRLASGGGLTTVAGSRIDASGATNANAGRILMHADEAAALGGALLAQAGSDHATGGSFDLHAGSLANAGDLVDRLQAGGFTERQALHVETGDLTLGTGRTVTARTIEWTTDAGQITIDGTMRAPSEARRSSIGLYGADGVTLGASGVLNADATAGVRFGGDIELGTTQGSLALAGGSSISAAGALLDGSLRLRAAATASDVSITSLASNISDIDSVVIETVRGYDVGPLMGAADFDVIRNDIATYMSTADATIRARLGDAGSLLRVQAGVELRHNGDLTLNDPNGTLDLANWRFADNPTALTVRAAGDITVNGTISDGFGQVGARTTLLDQESATLRFAAGANLASANPNAVVRGAAGDFILSTDATVRTGTGDLRVNASSDVLFNPGASVYTGGINGAPVDTLGLTANRSFNFPDRGGNVSITAGRDVRVADGGEATNGVTDWQWRLGAEDGALPFYRTQWGTDLNRFNWHVATLGGGDVNIAAGNDVTNISAAAADSAIELTDNVLTRFGGGSLSVTAGNDINSAMLYVAQSEGRILADGGLGMTRGAGTLGSMLMMGDASVSILGRDDVHLERMFDPMTLAQPVVPSLGTRHRLVFFTYSEDSGVDIRSNGGDVSMIAGANSRLDPYLGSNVTTPNAAALQIMPASLTMMSMARDVQLREGPITLFPSDSGQLDIFAARDFTADLGATIIMSDVGSGEVITPLQPVRSSDFASYVVPGAASARHRNDPQPVLITAGRDIVGANVTVAKAARVTVGRDIIDTTLDAQNMRPTDVTTVQAGRDIRYSPNLVVARMKVGGPGRFDVISGRHLDLGFSEGLTTTGRLSNPSIQYEDGADLNVLVGMGRDMDRQRFLALLDTRPELRDSLLELMRARTGNSKLTYEAAKAAFDALDSTTREPVLMDLFYGELVAAGREYNQDNNTAYQRGYRAIDALFPGSRPGEGEVNAYQGDLTMAFSRIYTLAGGNINIAVPGGLVNVGLANPPKTVAPRAPYQLGIVAQREGNVNIFANNDVLVNQSRIFTLLGGDIAIWSTLGNIDAGRGSKSSVSAPPPGVIVDSSGQVTLNFAGAVAGSGIRTIVTDESVEYGNVDLIAPQGTVNAGDAGVGTQGNLNIAAQQVLGLDNIQVGGISTGVPAETSGLGASLASVSAAASSSSSAAEAATEEDDDSDAAQATLAQAALSWLEVFVIGLGEENCKTDDVECLKRQPLN